MLNYYKYYADGLQSNVIVCYEDGYLQSFEVETPQETNTEKRLYGMYKSELEFLEGSKQYKVIITKIEREINFEMFYEKFNNKVGKLEAKKAWDKLTKLERQQAYDFIPSYLNHKRQTNSAIQYPASYLNSKRFIK